MKTSRYCMLGFAFGLVSLLTGKAQADSFSFGFGVSSFHGYDGGFYEPYYDGWYDPYDSMGWEPLYPVSSAEISAATPVEITRAQVSPPLTFQSTPDWDYPSNPWPATSLTTIERWEQMGETHLVDSGSPAVVSRPVKAKSVIRSEIPADIRERFQTRDFKEADRLISMQLMDAGDAPYLRGAQVLARWADGEMDKAAFSLWRLLTLRSRYELDSWVLDINYFLGSETAVNELFEQTKTVLASAELEAEQRVRIQVLLGWGMIQTGQTANAREVLQQALEARPASRQIMTLLRMLPAPKEQPAES